MKKACPIGAKLALLSYGLLALTACGGGGGGSSGTGAPMTAAPSGLQYPTVPAFVINRAIAPLTPTVVGQVTSYAVSPGLPQGLSLSTTTGVISGTPTRLAAKTNYTIKATNAGGSSTAIVSIVVNDVAPSILYSSYYAFTANVAAQITPAVSGGAVVTWDIKPPLPTGLVFSNTDGSISGTPTAAAAPSTYTVTATNSGGQSIAVMTLAIAGAPLLDLGHSSTVELIRYANSSLISLDQAGHWVLQDYASGTMLASGDGACVNCTPVLGRFVYPSVDVAGTTAIDAAAGGVEVRSVVDGRLLATIPGQFSWFQLASDGSYIATGSTTALTAWNTAGQVVVSRPGNYSNALAFSAPGQIQVALGAAGQNVIETVSVTSGTSSISPAFQGAFNTWFVDGTCFLTNLGNDVWTYSSAAVQLDIKQVTTVGELGGQGNWFWSTGGGFNIYQVGASASPAFTGSGAEYVIPSGTTIGLYSDSTDQLTVIDLSGATPVSTSYTLPIDDLSAYAASSASAWLAGNEHDVILDGASLAGQPRYLTLGTAGSIAAGTGYFSVATASGEILYFSASTDAMVGTINFANSQLSMSLDGTVLAAPTIVPDIQNPPNSTVNIYSLPSANPINSFPFNSPVVVDMSLSGSGTVLALSPSITSGCSTEAVAITGGAPIWCGTPGTVQLSPDGTLVATSTSQVPGTTTTVYKNGVAMTAVPGWVVGWLDNERLLVNEYGSQNMNPNPIYVGAEIFNSAGNKLGSAPIPELQSLQVVTSETVYSPQTNTILSLTTGAPSWASANAICPVVCSGAVSGSQVIFASGALVLAQPY